MLNVLYVTLLQMIVFIVVEAHPVRHLSSNSIFGPQRVRRQPEGAAAVASQEPATSRQAPPSFIPLGADIPLQDNEVEKVVPHKYSIIPPARQPLPPLPLPQRQAAVPLPEIIVGEAFIAATTFSPKTTTEEPLFPVADEIVVEPHQRIPSRFQSLSAYPVQFGNPPPPKAPQQPQVPPQPSPLPSPPLVRSPPIHQQTPAAPSFAQYLPPVEAQSQSIAAPANVHSHPTHQQSLTQAFAHHEPFATTEQPSADIQLEQDSNEVHHHQSEPIAEIIHEHHHSETDVPSENHSHDHHPMVTHSEFTEAPAVPISASASASVVSLSDHGPAPVIDHIGVMATVIPEQQPPVPVHHQPVELATAPSVHHQPSLPQLPPPPPPPAAAPVVAIPVVQQHPVVISPPPAQPQPPPQPTIAVQDDVIVPANPPPSNSILSALPPPSSSSSGYGGSSFSIQPAYPSDNYYPRGLEQSFHDNNFNSHHSSPININHPTPKRLGFPPVTSMAENWRYDVDWHRMTSRSIRFV